MVGIGDASLYLRHNPTCGAVSGREELTSVQLTVSAIEHSAFRSFFIEPSTELGIWTR